MDGMPTNFEPVGRGFESLRARQKIEHFQFSPPDFNRIDSHFDSPGNAGVESSAPPRLECRALTISQAPMVDCYAT